MWADGTIILGANGRTSLGFKNPQVSGRFLNRFFVEPALPREDTLQQLGRKIQARALLNMQSHWSYNLSRLLQGGIGDCKAASEWGYEELKERIYP